MLMRIVVDNTQALREMKEFTAGMTKTARKTEQSGDRIERANKKAAKSVTTLRATWLKAGVAVGAVTAAAVAVDRLAKKADDVTNLGRAFDTLTARIDTTANVMLPAMREATRGLVNDMELQRQANQAIILGVAESSEQYSNLIKNAIILGKSLGIDTVRAIESVTTGIGRQSIRWLDNLGIVFSVDDANREYAATLGKEASALTDAERKQAFLNKAMRESSAAVVGLELKVDTLAGAWNVAAVAVSNYFANMLDGINSIPEGFQEGGFVAGALGAVAAVTGNQATAGVAAVAAERHQQAQGPTQGELLGSLGFLDVSARTEKEREREETIRLEAATADAFERMVEAKAALLGTQIDILQLRTQTDLDIQSLVGEPKGKTDTPLQPTDPTGVNASFDATGDQMIAAATAADKQLYDTLGENFDLYLQSRAEKELIALDNEYALKAARVITGEEMITAAVLAGLEERNLATMELTEAQHEQLLMLAQERAAKESAITAGVALSGKKWADMDIKDKRKASLKIAANASSMASAQFGKDKALRISTAIMNTAVGVSNMLGFQPPNMVPVMQAFAAALGAAQVAKIASTKAPGAARGTIITGGTPGVDSVDYSLMRGEAVLPAGLTAFLQQAAARSGASANTNQGGVPSEVEAGGSTFNVSIHAVDARSFQEMMEDNPDAFASAFRNAVSVGEL